MQRRVFSREFRLEAAKLVTSAVWPWCRQSVTWTLPRVSRGIEKGMRQPIPGPPVLATAKCGPCSRKSTGFADRSPSSAQSVGS